MLSYTHFTRIERIKLEELKEKVFEKLPESWEGLLPASAESFVEIEVRRATIIGALPFCIFCAVEIAIRHPDLQKVQRSATMLRISFPFTGLPKQSLLVGTKNTPMTDLLSQRYIVGWQNGRN